MNKKQLIVAWIKIITAFQAMYKTIFILIRSLLKLVWADIKDKLPTWILAIVAIASLWITYTNVELANRPFISIEEVYWRQEEGSPWFISGFKMKNYGNKPAQEFFLKNVRVVILTLNNELLKEKLKQEYDSIPEQYFQEYQADLRNKVYWETANLSADYFRNHSKANKSDTENFIKSWENASFKNNKLKFNGKLLVNIVEVNNDMFDYFSKTKMLVYPNQEDAGRRYAQQMGEGGIEGVKKENNFLIAYWSIEYKSLMRKTYSTNYVGYQLGTRKITDLIGDRPVYLLHELRSWSKTE